MNDPQYSSKKTYTVLNNIYQYIVSYYRTFYNERCHCELHAKVHLCGYRKRSTFRDHTQEALVSCEEVCSVKLYNFPVSSGAWSLVMVTSYWVWKRVGVGGQWLPPGLEDRESKQGRRLQLQYFNAL